MNSILRLKEQGVKPTKIVTYGTGNHATALSWASRLILGCETQACLPAFVRQNKLDNIKRYGGSVTITKTRAEAEELAHELSKQDGCILIPPSSNDDVIAGAATVAYEIFNETHDLDAIFVPIGGGSHASGTLLSRGTFSPSTKVYAAEPENANDASISYRTGQLFRFKDTPPTIADGVTTLGVTPKIFEHIKKLDGIYEISEQEIEYWTIWFKHLTGIDCETTSALSLAAAYRFNREHGAGKRLAVVITGSNLDVSMLSTFMHHLVTDAVSLLSRS
jgi:threonine dehydratase